MGCESSFNALFGSLFTRLLILPAASKPVLHEETENVKNKPGTDPSGATMKDIHCVNVPDHTPVCLHACVFLSVPCKALSQHCVQTWGRTLQRQHNLEVIMQEAAAGPCVQRAMGHTCKRPMLYSAGRDSEIKFICVSKSHNKHFTAPQKPLVTCVHNPDTPESLHPEPIRRRAS